MRFVREIFQDLSNELDWLLRFLFGLTPHPRVFNDGENRGDAQSSDWPTTGEPKDQ
jgi:hypothetical protein